jgi:hypothetical protein
MQACEKSPEWHLQEKQVLERLGKIVRGHSQRKALETLLRDCAHLDSLCAIQQVLGVSRRTAQTLQTALRHCAQRAREG